MKISPCNKVCKLDPTQQFCVGCFRTIGEIGMWVGMDETQQAKVTALCEIRRTSYRIEKRMKERGSDRG